MADRGEDGADAATPPRPGRRMDVAGQIAQLEVPQRLVWCCTLVGTFGAPERRRDKAQLAAHGGSMGKSCNAGPPSLRGSLRARLNAAIGVVASPRNRPAI